jgi:hypothetical protein
LEQQTDTPEQQAQESTEETTLAQATGTEEVSGQEPEAQQEEASSEKVESSDESSDEADEYEEGNPWWKQRIEKDKIRKANYRNEIEALKAEIHQLKNPQEQVDVSTLNEEEKAKFYAEQAVLAQQQQQAKMAQSQQTEINKANEWRSANAERIAELPHFDRAMNEAQNHLDWSAETTKDVMDFIYESDVGADVIYKLTTEPEVGNRLAGKSGRALDRALFRIESELRQKPISYKKRSAVTKAEPPVSAPKGSAKVVNPSNMSPADFAAWRRKQIYGK